VDANRTDGWRVPQDEAMVLFLHLLKMPLAAGVVDSKSSPHPSAADWPRAVVRECPRPIELYWTH
jgi:hypothetical protein